MWSFLQSDNQALEIAEQVHTCWRRWWGRQPGVVFTIWDLARLDVLSLNRGPWDLWGYLPIDAASIAGGLGPYRAIAQRFDRVLAYGGYGRLVLGSGEYLPHGLDRSWWDDANVQRRQPIIGTVMTNQPRKDWGTALGALAALRTRGHKVKLWAHTDRAVGHWDLPSLIAQFGLARVVQLTEATDAWTDAQLRAAYQQCAATMLPSLGEGHGYPIVESLASGVPCVHTTFGGGAELVPRPEWKVPERGAVLTGMGLVRPVLDPADVANALERVWAWQAQWPDGGVAYCRGSVQHLDWRYLYPRWRRWVKQGLDDRQ